MADQDWNGLPYGHFGNAFYHPDEQTWQFEKAPGLPRILEPIGHPEISVPPSRPFSSSPLTNGDTEPPSVRCEKEKTELVKLVPSLQPARTLLEPLLHASEAIENTTSRHDPVRGSLLSFGRIFDASTRRTTQVAAFASGPTGSDLRVVQVQLQKQGWDDSRDVWLEMPVINGEEAIWRNEGPPVQQICFAQPLESGENLLAVRTTSRVMIFKPVLRKTGPNRLHLKPLFEASTADNEGITHADVAFNPWFPRQFAIIDQAARWRIWEFRSRESSDASCIHASTNDDQDAVDSDPNDGWARLIWTCNPSVVLLATRRKVTLHDITATWSQLQEINVKVSGSSSWVLDVATVPSDPARLLILTTTHIYVVAVKDTNGEARAQTALQIRHFRDSEDITLRFTPFRDDEGMFWLSGHDVKPANDRLALTIVLRSSLSPTLVSFRLIISDDQKMILNDPIQFELGFSEDQSDDRATILSLHMQSVAIAEKRSTNVEDTLIGHLRQEECRFNTLTMLKNDLSINSVLFLDHRSDQPTLIPAPPTWRGKLLGTSSKIKDDFVVDDALVVADHVENFREPVARYIEQRRRRAKLLFGQEWTLHHERTADRVEHRTVQAQSVDEVLTQTQDILDRRTEAIPMQTLLERSTGELTMNDMDRVSAEISQLTAKAFESTPQPGDEMDDNDHNTRVVVRAIEAASLPAMSLHSSADVAPTYDVIVSHWITPLHNKVPGRIRLAKEQLARRLAAELTLASHVLQVEDIEEQPETQDAKPVQESQSWSLPMHLASSQLQNPYSSQIHSQSHSILPTPSPSGTPSVTTASSRATTLASAEISNLTKFTTFTKPTPSALPRNLSKILSHWTPGTDPAAYDWIATSRAISQRTREEEADSQLTEKQRARAHRKAERHIRRQRKEAQASQVQMLASSQMPELVVSASQSQPRNFGGSSPARQGTMPPPPTAFGGGGVLNSSQPMGFGAASQAVPGRFGGRPPVKKKRKQGF